MARAARYRRRGVVGRGAARRWWRRDRRTLRGYARRRRPIARGPERRAWPRRTRGTYAAGVIRTLGKCGQRDDRLLCGRRGSRGSHGRSPLGRETIGGAGPQMTIERGGGRHVAAERGSRPRQRTREGTRGRALAKAGRQWDPRWTAPRRGPRRNRILLTRPPRGDRCGAGSISDCRLVGARVRQKLWFFAGGRPLLWFAVSGGRGAQARPVPGTPARRAQATRAESRL